MEQSLEQSRRLISEGKIEEAVETLKQYISGDLPHQDEAFYLLGNAYRKLGNWQEAIQNYMEATERNPESPAKEAHRMMMEIMEFYNKDMFNQ